MAEDDTTIWAIPDADDDDRDDDDEGGATTFRSTKTTLVSTCPRLSMMRMIIANRIISQRVESRRGRLSQ